MTFDIREAWKELRRAERNPAYANLAAWTKRCYYNVQRLLREKAGLTKYRHACEEAEMLLRIALKDGSMGEEWKESAAKVFDMVDEAQRAYWKSKDQAREVTEKMVEDGVSEADPEAPY